ncbi:methyltransferase [Streptomyces silvensis]|uniref:Methyltransferase n=1 Tax=Streptomyces silvensis TaxID=1765722 RepID=A0A0W7X894_9ACTN|nr:methyltransferase [Streptomyces silvensis]KUF18971.1 methyltransferase [Streptomyces silvensis]
MTHNEDQAAGAAAAAPAPAADIGRIVQIAFGGMAAQTLRAALRLRVVELIGDKEKDAADVAALASAQPQPMTRLLRAMTALGLLEERAPGTFAVTSTGALLDPGRPGALTSFVRMFTEPMMLRSWERLDDSVRTGDIAFDKIHGTDFFGHLKDNPELSAAFNGAMGEAVRQTASVLPHAVDFSRFSTVMDIGGGDGTLLSGVLGAHPALTGVVYDTEEGLAQAPGTLRRNGLADRCSLVAGDFFRSVPEGADLHLMKSIVHDWPDERVVTILRNCRAALPSGGRVLIVEPVLPEVVDPETAGLTYLSDLNMLVNVGGRERTRAEFEDLCHRAGLTVTSVTPLAGARPFHAVEAAVDE